MKYFKRGTTSCPKENAKLEWELFQGMRVKKSHHGKSVYQARCPICLTYWAVEA